MTIIVNPGSEWHPETHSPEAAAFNMEALVADLGSGTFEPIIGADPESTEAKLMMGGTRYQKDHDGRYPFLLTLDGKRHLVEMPGLALDEVRYVSEDQNIWDFPRLFIDGSSWVWKFGLDVLQDDECGDWGEYLGD